jgi:iron complex outermembrane recepter protein
MRSNGRSRCCLGAVLGLALAAMPLHAQDGDNKPGQPLPPSPGAEADTALLPTISLAQAEAEPGRAAAAERPRSRIIEEIVVTAQKREEYLRDVPLSVSAFSAEQLDARSVLDVQDLPKVTPGLTVTTQVGFTSVFLRGVGADTFLLGDPSVASYTDDVYFPFAVGMVQDFGAIERIEVLKGPQGTLFGRNALGGAIRIITREPSLDRAELSLQTIYGERSTSKTRVYAGVPLGDSLAISLGGYYNAADHVTSGCYRNGQPLPSEYSRGARAKLRWDPADWLSLRLSHYDIYQDAIGGLYAPNTEPALLFRAVIQPQDPYAGAVNENAAFEVENRTTSGQVALRTDAFDVKLFGSDQAINNRQAADFDGSPTPLVYFEGATFFDVQTAELQILSNDTTWGTERLEWIVGAYWFKSNGGISPANLRVASTNLAAGQLLGVQLPDALADLVRRLFGNLPIPSGDISTIGVLDTESIAYFGQATLRLSDWLSLTLGGRYQSEERVLEKSTANLRNFDGTFTTFMSFSDPDDPLRAKTESFDPKILFSLHPGDGWLGIDPLLYAGWQTATKSATYNVVNITQAPEEVRAEEMTSWEAGIKTRLFDGLMQLDMAVFQYDVDDPQVQVVSLLNGGSVSFENAGGLRIRGIDFDTLVQLFPSLTDGGLVMTLSGAFLDSVYTSYPDGSGFDPQTGLFSRNNDFTGNQVVRTPKFSGTAGLSYTLPVWRGPLEVGASYYYNSGFYYLAQGTPNVEEAAYGTLGVSLSYLYEPWNLRVTAFGRNVTNERYNVGRFIVDFGTTDAVAELATWGLRLNLDF